ncbi:TIGR01777 family oxidoreductase [Bacillus spongiae]|uniref:TIGR01777 family oxidoreductase n=1 Tax=Bacillus spongiae TaxID=2683610 RepID=A0ABU8HHF5_9BACI
MKIAITGGTGFIGKHLVKALLKHEHEVYVLTRHPYEHYDEKVKYIEWLTEGSKPEDLLVGIDAFINLAGEPINNGRWTKKQKEKIIQSRRETTREVLRIMEALPIPPSVFINASAIGYYNASNEMNYTESSTETGTDFLANTVVEWETEASKAEQLPLRVAYARFGIILGQDGGALPRMALPYKFFIGGPVGSGRQWLSWIHIEDVCKAIIFILNHSIKGPVNIVAPNPLQMDEFGHILGQVIQRPHWLPVPSPVMKAVLGEMSTLVLDGQKVIPEVLLKNGFDFSYPTLKPALKDLLQ